MPKARKITSAEIQMFHEYLRYEESTGVLYWKKRQGKKVSEGGVVGCKKKDSGYVIFFLFGKAYRAHRAILAMHFGEDSDLDVDHINGDRADNRISNLRFVSNSVNMQNQRKATARSKTGILGVCPQKNMQRFSAQITVDGRTKHLGTFETTEEAQKAYIQAKRLMHEGCTL